MQNLTKMWSFLFFSQNFSRQKLLFSCSENASVHIAQLSTAKGFFRIYQSRLWPYLLERALPIYLSVYLSIYLSIYPSIYLCVFLWNKGKKVTKKVHFEDNFWHSVSSVETFSYLKFTIVSIGRHQILTNALKVF